MIGKTKIKDRTRRKTNVDSVRTIREALKKDAWEDVAKIVSSSTRKYVSLNLFEIDARSSEGDTIIIPGKVLSKGELTKKLRVCAMSFSEKAVEKIKSNKSEVIYLVDEIIKNPKAEGVKILR